MFNYDKHSAPFTPPFDNISIKQVYECQMTQEQLQALHQTLWNIANTLRGKMSADEFRDYILGLIFYKYLSDKQLLHANKILKGDSLEYTSAAVQADQDIVDAVEADSLEELGYFLKPTHLFSSLAARGGDTLIIEELEGILTDIEKSTMGTESEDDFGNLFEDLDLTSSKLGKTTAEKNELITKILKELDSIDFQLEDLDGDVLGDAYEYLIAQFAAGAGKKAGEFYTPQEVSTILAKLSTIGKTRIKSAYDPTCGSGSLLLRVAKEVEVATIYGQEMNPTTYNLARMNMIMHDVSYTRFDIKNDNTLERPMHEGQQFEAIVANPPFSAKWNADQLKSDDDRFSQAGKLAPSSKADYAFIQHMVHHLADNGTLAVVVPHGALFRGAAEGHIRQYLIEDRNYLDAVIGLPANIFYGTSIPTCIMVFKKCRNPDDSVLFIDASNEYTKNKNQNKLDQSHIDKIVETYTTRQDIDKYSHNAQITEIADNDYNLNIPRYVDTYEPEPAIDLAAVTAQIQDIDTQMESVDTKIADFCKQLGINSPF